LQMKIKPLGGMAGKYEEWETVESFHVFLLVVKLNKKQIGIEVKKVGRSWKKPRHLEKTFLLTKNDIPIFLASIDT
jgi:hypothetical protein